MLPKRSRGLFRLTAGPVGWAWSLVRPAYNIGPTWTSAPARPEWPEYTEPDMDTLLGSVTGRYLLILKRLKGRMDGSVRATPGPT